MLWNGTFICGANNMIEPWGIFAWTHRTTDSTNFNGKEAFWDLVDRKPHCHEICVVWQQHNVLDGRDTGAPEENGTSMGASSSGLYFDIQECLGRLF
jgi:hypothetical protein